MAGAPPLLQVAYHAIAGRNITYLDFVVPGIMGLMAMNNSLFGLSANLTRWKETRVLRRLLATPASPASFLGAALVNQLVYGILALGVVVVMALAVLKAQETVVPLTLAILLILGVGTFLAIGLAIGGMARTQEAVTPMINVVAFPMMFLSGVFFPVSDLPGVLHHIVNYLPLTLLAAGLRATMNDGLTWSAGITFDVVGLLAWTAAAVLVAMRTWRWE
jgi:ABC-2 type transport system permease protein